MMTTKTTSFLLFFCISNLTIHAMYKVPPVLRMIDNLHENTKKQLVLSNPYQYKQDPLRTKERRRTIFLKKERGWKNNLYLPHGK